MRRALFAVALVVAVPLEHANRIDELLRDHVVTRRFQSSHDRPTVARLTATMSFTVSDPRTDAPVLM